MVRSCEAHSHVFKFQERSKKQFHDCGGPMKLGEAWLTTKKDLESSSSPWWGPVKLVHVVGHVKLAHM